MRNYKIIASEKKSQQWEKIPDDWRISTTLYQDATNVMSVPVTCGLLNDTECDITSNYDATALLEKLKARVWSVEQVTVAFCKRAAIAHQLTNCLTEIFFDEAIERAKKLDSKHSKKPHGKTLPPLFGLPVSLKDSFQVSGHDTSTGLGCYVGMPAEENSALAAMLMDLGAILYCKTNLSQSILTGETDNNVFGRTMNPRNRHLTVGGSTGGEGALLALRGSILGVGTDIAGSIRVPSVCNGLYGFRPSVGLIPHGCVRDLTPPGTDGVRSTAGPLATTLRDCSLFLETILKADSWKYDSTAVSIPWMDIEPPKRLRIGFAENDGLFTPSPPVRRCLKQTADLLRSSNNIDIIPLSLPDVPRISLDLVNYLVLSGGDHYYEQFARTGEPLVPSLESLGLLSVPATTMQGYMDLNVRRTEASKTYLKLFRDNNLNAILMPPAPHTAVPLDCWTTATYTCLWNYLDYPAVVIPVDKVQDSDHADDLSNAKFGPDDEKLYSLYTGPKQYKNAPICVQIVGYKHRDEALTKTAGVLDAIINGI